MEQIQKILEQIPKAFGQSLMNYLIIVAVYLIVWKLLKKRLQNWRIQVKERVDAKQIKSELINSLFALMVSTFFVLIIYYLKDKGHTKIYADINEYPRFFAYFGFIIFLIIDDTWFYWVHRLLHHPKIFKYVHKVHHNSIDVNPFTSLSFHWFEIFALTFWIIPFSLFFPMYLPALGILQIWGFLDNIKSHLGYEFFPSWWNKSFGKLMTSSTHHNMHHSKFQGNYGVHFRIWDRLLKTEFKDYEAEFDKIQKRKKTNILKPLATISLLFFFATGYSQSNLIGKWTDKDHNEKSIEIYISADKITFGKDNSGKIVLKNFNENIRNKTFSAILVNPENDEEFKIDITQANKDLFYFVVKKFIFSKKFTFERQKGSR